jgi:[acyl-carrier-protein] S-malonyltransferase
MTLALLCSGQGNQHAEMFRTTGSVPAAQPLFEHAATLLGGDPRTVFERAGNTCFDNRPAQLLCTLQALAAHAAVRDVLPRRLCIAGYSVGELAAWGVAGALTGEETLDLAAARADAMTAAATATAGPQGMLFVRGLLLEQITSLCNTREAALAIANPGDAWVIGGRRDALDLIAGEATQLGAARVGMINVAVASHTRFMDTAATAFSHRLSSAHVAARLAPGIRLFSGIDGAAVFNTTDGAAKLARQISQTIHWEACLQACVEAGTTAFLELGPGRALTDMATGAHPGIPARSLDDFRDLSGARDWLAKVCADRT